MGISTLRDQRLKRLAENLPCIAAVRSGRFCRVQCPQCKSVVPDWVGRSLVVEIRVLLPIVAENKWILARAYNVLLGVVLRSDTRPIDTASPSTVAQSHFALSNCSVSPYPSIP